MNNYSVFEALGINPSDQGYYRHPTVFDDRIVFVSEDDLWEVPRDGGFARRLTGAAGEAVHPFYSPDGRRVAFTSTEEGAPEVFVMSARGGPAKQLTFNGAQSTVVGWSRDGERVLFRSNFREPFRRTFVLYSVDAEGGEAQRLPLGPAHSLAFEPDGPGRVLARNTDDLARWKRYKGGTAGVLWVDARGNDQWVRLLPEIASGLCRPMWIGERIYFLSDFEGYGNLYSCTPDGQDLRRHTGHTGFYVRSPSTDGRTIVYTCGGDIYALDVASDEVRRVDIDYGSPRAHLKRKFTDAEDYLEDFSLHPRGHSLVVNARGKAFNFGNWEGAVRQTGVEQGVRYRLARYLNDGERIVLTSDQSGEERLEIHHADGSKHPRVVDTGTFDIGRPLELIVSPIEDAVVLTNHRHEVVYVHLGSGEARQIERSEYARISGIDWSSDGRWLAYGFFTDFSTSTIKIANVSTGETHTVTSGEFQDLQPVFDPAGRYLYFLSYRYFDPVYDQMFFELSFPRGMKPCLVTLREDVESPFVERPRPLDGEDEGDGLPASSEGDEEAEPQAGADEAENASSNEEDGGTDEPAELIEIDFEGIRDRILSFPVRDANYGDIGATEDRVYWTVFPIEGALGRNASDDDNANGTLRYFSLKSLKEKTFARRVSTFEIGPDGKTMAMWTDDGLQVVSASAESAGGGDDDDDTPSRETGFIDLGRLSLCVEPRAEWCQMLREAWRLMRDHFWLEDMAGVDWEAAWERYKPLLGRVLTRSEFSDLVWIMQGELGTSHAYEMGGDYPVPPQYRPGFLGAELAWDSEWKLVADGEARPADESQGAYRIRHIVRGDVWNPAESSPLARPGLKLAEGDVIVAINGQRVSEHVSVEQRLVNQAGKEVELVVGRGDGTGGLRTVTVKTLRAETPARYREWVLQNRRRVHEATDGKIGYVHIPDMGPAGYAEFHRNYLSENTRQGLIVDVRYNGGGHVSQLILEKLARKHLGYDIQRWGRPMPYPQESISGPLVALTNEHAGSDGDIFSHSFKLMKLGPLLGKRTWGGVVGIWPRHALVDGSITTQPEFSFWFKDVGFGVENHGTDPDIEVENPPQADEQEEDPQLQAAIDKTLELLEAQPPTLPDFAPYPRMQPPASLPSARKPSPGED